MQNKKKFPYRILFDLLTDSVIVNVSLFFALLLRYNFEFSADFNKNLVRFFYNIPMTVVVFSVFFIIFKVYKTMWKYADIIDFSKMCISLFLSTACCWFISYPLKINLPFSVYCIGAFIILVLEILLRMFVRFFSTSNPVLVKPQSKNFETKNAMIIGSGSAAALLINDYRNNHPKDPLKIVCAIDDNPLKIGKAIYGVPVVGDRFSIIENALKYKIHTIIFAIPSCEAQDRTSILNLCSKTGCEVKTLPEYNQIVNNYVNSSNLRKVEIEDLLGRPPIKINLEKVMGYVKEKTVLVTGGGGSIGSELCRQIASHQPKKLIVFDIYENSAFEINNELKKSFPNLDIITLIGSVRDSERINSIFEQYKPDIVYHAAAHKHVPLMEDSPNESIKNNVFGTLNTAKAADKHGAEKFVLISTDKAVNPTNIMGASKRICEMIVQTCNKHSNTDFVAVRFGNVLGSNGSVIPIFKKQIKAGGPVTVTHPDIIRFFMTIPEAVSLVLQAGADAKGGEIFVLDMGEPVKILDLAENLIRLSGLEPYKDIDIKFTGLRPGEKLYEELLMDEEGLTATDNKLIHIGKPINIDEESFLSTLNEMNESMHKDNSDIRKLVKKLVPTYNYNNG